MKSNRLIWIIAVAAVALVLSIMGNKQPTTPPADLIQQRPEPGAGDLPADTLNTVAARLSELTRTVDQLQRNIDQMEKNRAAISRRIDRIEQAYSGGPGAAQGNTNSIDALKQQLEQQLKQLKVSGGQTAGNNSQQSPAATQPLPYPINTAIPNTQAAVTTAWVSPLSTPPSMESMVQPQTDSKAQAGYTVPRNAIISGRALTALIGRIPFDGTVQDPYPVRIITDPDAILAGHASWPEDLDRLVWSGIASGDWALSCVRVRLTSVTFIYSNGDIATFEDENLGSISDATGIPCIAGEKITNAAPALSARFATAAMEAAARGYAQAQVVTTQGAGGTTVSIDDALMYGGMRALAGGMSDTKSWIDQRLGQIFDAVYVPPGAPVAVHVDREITLLTGGTNIAQETTGYLDTLD